MTIELPGLFDLQVNGFAGVDFNGADLTADRAAEALDCLRGTGVTRLTGENDQEPNVLGGFGDGRD